MWGLGKDGWRRFALNREALLVGVGRGWWRGEREWESSARIGCERLFSSPSYCALMSQEEKLGD